MHVGEGVGEEVGNQVGGGDAVILGEEGDLIAQGGGDAVGGGGVFLLPRAVTRGGGRGGQEAGAGRYGTGELLTGHGGSYLRERT